MKCKCTECGDEHYITIKGFYIRFPNDSIRDTIDNHSAGGFSSVAEAIADQDELQEGDYTVIDSDGKVYHTGHARGQG